MTQHQLQAWIDGEAICSRVVCENPQDCQDTAVEDRRYGCLIEDLYDNAVDLLAFPDDIRPLLGQIPVDVRWQDAENGPTPELIPTPSSLPDPSESVFEAAKRLTTDDMVNQVGEVIGEEWQRDTDPKMRRDVTEDLLEYLLEQGWIPPGEMRLYA